MANDFQLLLTATIDEKAIRAQLDNIAKNYKFPIGGSTGGSGSSGSTGSGIKLFDLENIRKAWSDGKITTDQAEEAQRRLAVMQQNAIDMNTKFDAKRLQDIQKIGNENLKWEKKRQDEFAKYQRQVDAFYAQSKGKDMSSPQGQNSLAMAGKMQAAIDAKDINSLRTLKDEAALAKIEMQNLDGATESFGITLGKAALDMAKTMIVMQGIQFAMQQIGDGVQYIRDLDKELNNIRLVTGQSKESAEALGVSYNKMASDLGSTTLEVTRGALEWQRQGKSVEDTNKLIEYSTKLSVLGNMSSTESAEKLTSVMNGYKLSMEQIAPTLSKIIALDNNFATSTEKITTAMSYASNSAQQVGIDLDHLMAYETVISSINPALSGETLGQAMKTMTARFSDIERGMVADDGVGINDIAKSLRLVNIEMEDMPGHARPMQDIIDELGKKWKDIGEEDKKLIIKDFAGIRQKEQFLSLMENQIPLQKAYNAEKEAGNLLDKNYSIYLESAEAAEKRRTDAWEKSWQATMNSDGLIFLDTMVAKTLDLVAAGGGWLKVIEEIGKGLVPTLTWADNITKFLDKSPLFWEWVNGLKIMKQTFDGLNSSFSSMFGNSTPKITEQKKAVDDLTQSYYKLTDAQGTKNYGPEKPKMEVPIFDLNSQLEAINNMVKDTGSLIAKASSEALSFNDVQELIAKNPKFIDYVTMENDKIKINTEGLRQLDLQKVTDALVTAEQVLAADKYNKASEETIQQDQKTVDVLKSYKAAIIDGSAYSAALEKDREKAAKAAQKAAEDALKAEKDAAQIRLKFLQDQKKAADDLLKLVIEMIKSEKQQEKEHLNQQMKDYDDLIDKRIEALDSLKAEEDYKKKLAKDEKKSAGIKSQIAILSLDNSPEAKAKILKLQQDLADQTDKIKEESEEHKLKLQKEALQQEKEQFNNSIKDKIQVIEDYLKQTGTITNDALDLINNHGDELYSRLINWNKIYGSGIDQDIVDAWNKGKDAVAGYGQLLIDIKTQQDVVTALDSKNINDFWDNATKGAQLYIDKLKEIPEPPIGSANGKLDVANPIDAVGGVIVGDNSKNKSSNWWDQLFSNPFGNPFDNPFGKPKSSLNNPFNNPLGVHHSGLDSGPVGGLKLASNEQLTKLLKGEIVVNEANASNFMKNVLPNIAQSTSNVNNNGNIHFDNLINVNGDVTKDVIPDLNKIANTVIEKLNNANFSRGMKRQSNITNI